MTRSTLIATLFAALSLAACGGSQGPKDNALLGNVQNTSTYDYDVDNQPVSILEQRHLATAFATYQCGKEPIYFAADSAELMPQSRTQLKYLSWCVRDYRVNDIVVAPRPGSSDTMDSTELASARAQAVTVYLTELGVDTKPLRFRQQGDGLTEGEFINPTRAASTPVTTPAPAVE